MANKNILDLENDKAKEFFLKGKRYCTIDLPKYFSFDKILEKIDKILKNKNLHSFYGQDKVRPENLEKVNYKLYDNKDGKYAWRLLELIHPVIYVALVHQITKRENWELITYKFKEWQKLKNIKCMSIPIIEEDERKNEKATQILNWWEKVEQESIKLSLDYQYVFHTDIVDCYGAIYTHSIAWALHGKDVAKKNNNKHNKNLIGNVIDKHIRMMRYGQTNGIPQGSVLMNFIAEMVLGYADELLDKKIEEIKDYNILRYRDDYRIFTNSINDGEKILKELSNVLSSHLGMRLGAGKTIFSDDIIESSIKKDKLFSWRYINKNNSLAKQLFNIKEIANKFPNSGSLIEPINKIGEIKNDSKIENKEVILALLVDLMYRNPRLYPNCCYVVSNILSFLEKSEKQVYIEKIKTKFDKLPNTELLNIWLQRITYKINSEIEYKGNLCNKVINDEKQSIWNNDWLQNPDNFMCDIISREEIENMGETIEFDEIKIFNNY